MNHVFKSFTSALLGAAALASLATGCVREQFNTNPNYNPDKNTVTTKFVLNVNPKTGDDTKMTAANVQASGSSFLGMQEAHILTYKMDAGNTPSFDGAPATTGAGAAVGKFYFNPFRAGKATEDYNFGRLFDAGTVTDTKQSRIMELSFPLETNVVVLYGKALNTKGPEHQGSITSSGDPANLASLRFSLTPRVDPSNKLPYTAGTYALQGVISSLTIAGLVDEQKYWTTDGKAKSDNNQYQPTGTAHKQYKIWLPYEPTDALYKKISGANTGGEGIFTDPSGEDYEDGDTYERRGDDPVSTHTYKLKIGNCSWKMLGDMYAAEHDGVSTTSADIVCNACGGNGLQFVPLLGTLGEAYHKLITVVDLKDGDKTYHELRAGSAAAILRTLRDLDFILHKALDAQPANWGEAIAQQLAKEIHTRMRLYFDGDKDNMVYRSAADIKSALYNNVKDVAAALALYNESGIATYFTNDYLRGTSTALDGTDGFPMNIGFPMGAAYLQADVKTPTSTEPYYFHADRFLFSEDIPAYAFGSEDKKFNIFNYCYPAELMYYGNSPLRVSELTHAEIDFPQTGALWKKDSEWGNDWLKFGNVSSKTQSVAMANCINYGSALLKASVVYDNNVSVLYDNNALIHNESPNEIPINDETNGLLVTGIVIGGQPAAVTWDFTRMPDYIMDKHDTPDDPSDDTIVGPPSYENVTFENGVFTHLTFAQDQFERMIYDRVDEEDRFRIKKESATDIDAGENTVYTLCWDNYDALKTAAEQSNVYIALELQNKTGMDFWGETNLVRKDAIFYLVGKLDLDKLRTTSSGNYGSLNGHLGDRSKTGYYYYPPFDPITGATIEVPRVFMQDYMTTAKLVLKDDALKHAYMSVPDLRSNQVSLGVSVDIKWETGLSFEVEMGKLN